MATASTTEPDQYGQVHPDETPELVKSKLQDLEVEMTKLPKEQKEAYEQAKVKCPDLLDDTFRLMFLRCEVFNVDLAAVRLAKYWAKRLEVFGPDKAFLPLTQGEAMKDDAVALHIGFFQVVPSKDPSGRSLVFGDPSRQDKTKYTRESMCRSMWYMMHARLEDEETQKKGIIIVVYPKKTKFSQFDRTLSKLNMDCIKGCLPVRVSVIHLCHPPTFFRVVFPIFQMFMGERLRKRFRVHGGSVDHVLERLATFGLTKDHLPSEIGGNVVLDIDGFLDARKAEGK